MQSLDKRIKCIVSACVLHNWCLIEDDDENFDDFEGETLDMNVGNNLTADAYLGRKRANGGGITKRDLLCQQISGLP